MTITSSKWNLRSLITHTTVISLDSVIKCRLKYIMSHMYVCMYMYVLWTSPSLLTFTVLHVNQQLSLKTRQGTCKVSKAACIFFKGNSSSLGSLTARDFFFLWITGTAWNSHLFSHWSGCISLFCSHYFTKPFLIYYVTSSSCSSCSPIARFPSQSPALPITPPSVTESKVNFNPFGQVPCSCSTKRSAHLGIN